MKAFLYGLFFGVVGFAAFNFGRLLFRIIN